MNTTKAIAAAAALCFLPLIACAQETRPYTDGPVVEVTYVRVKPGQLDTYMRHLAGVYRKQMDAFQKAGLVTAYRVYSVTPRSPAEPNVILTVTYPNMAALDKSQEFDAIGVQVAGSMSAQDKAYADRGSMREILGGALMREMILK
jgi:hypothetical protein